MIDENMLEKIKRILDNGDRVELIPVRNGVKVIRIRRNEIK